MSALAAKTGRAGRAFDALTCRSAAQSPPSARGGDGLGDGAAEAQTLRIEEANGVGHDLEPRVPRHQQLAVEVDLAGGVAVHRDGPAAAVFHQVAQLGVPPGLVFADHLRDGQPRDGLDHQHVEQTVVRLGLGQGIEAAAVPAAVGDADHGQRAFIGLVVHLDAIVAVDALDEVDAGRDDVGARAAQKREALVFADARADAGVEAHRADVERVVIALTADQVELRGLAVDQPVEIVERAGVGEQLDEVVARAAGVVRHGRVGKALHAVDDLVERAVAAAGIDAHRRAGCGRRVGKPCAVAGCAGDEDLIVETAPDAGRADLLRDLAGAVALPGGGVNDEQMLHRETPRNTYKRCIAGGRYRACAFWLPDGRRNARTPARTRECTFSSRRRISDGGRRRA